MTIRSAVLIAPVLAFATWTAAADTHVHLGESARVGNGTVQTYFELAADGIPRAIGITFDEALLDGLPADRNMTDRCFDLDGDGAFTGHECEGDHEVRMDMPAAVRSRADLLFEWVGFNWNPGGHPPPGVYDLPHFDIHFYMVGREVIDGIRLGSCETLINCDDHARAVIPVPAEHTPADHRDLGAVVGRMGNHLIDVTSPELGNPPKTFTHTFIYGAYDGAITFLEPMITRAFLLDRPDVCVPLKLPQSYARPGFYPTEYCMRHHGADGRYTVSLERFVQR